MSQETSDEKPTIDPDMTILDKKALDGKCHRKYSAVAGWDKEVFEPDTLSKRLSPLATNFTLPANAQARNLSSSGSSPIFMDNRSGITGSDIKAIK